MRLLLWLLIACACAGHALAAEPPDQIPPPTVSAQEIEELIGRLVSPNRPPRTRGPDAEYSPDYDKAAQQDVVEAFRRLYDLGPTAFSQLANHFDDKRYSLTEDDGPADHNWSVGEICRDIVTCHVQPFSKYGFTAGEGDPRSRPRRPNYFYAFRLNEPQRFQRWWARRAHLPLREVQVEILQWGLVEEVKRPNDYTVEERRSTEDQLRELEAASEPLKPAWPFAK